MKSVIAEHLVKTYRKGEVVALNDLSLDVEEGTVLGVLGPNGAGKTTTVRILATLLKPDSGHATVACPESGFNKVARILTVVVLPAPLGPSTPKTVPSSTSSDNPSRALTSPLR